MTADLNRRLASMFARGVVRHADIMAGLAVPQAEFLKDDLRRIELPQNFGFASSLLPGSEIFAIFRNGEEDAGIGVAHDDRRYRPLDLNPGETALYGKDVRNKPNRHWVLTTDQPKPGTIKVKASRLEFRAGQFYVLLDSDLTIGAQKGTWDPAQELPDNPGGAAL
jgi:phage gp45-like